MAIAAGLAALGQGKIGAAACEGMARNPAARAGIQLAMILGLAFVESLVLFTPGGGVRQGCEVVPSLAAPSIALSCL
jgi:hypothetical protein